MGKMAEPVDTVGYWSEIKLSIVKEYAVAYSTILAGRKSPSFRHIYIDAFAGAGLHISRTTGDFIPGSPTNALLVDPPFKEYHFIDLDGDKTDSLQSIVGNRNDVTIYNGDCNLILLKDIFPRCEFRLYRRGLCLLDPYGLHLNWDVMHTAGQMKTIDMFLNFPVADINRNVLRRNPDTVDPKQAERMTAFWGDNSWQHVAYDTTQNLFGLPDKQPNDTIAEAFRERLKRVAGFDYVPEPMPMRNSVNAIVYYLFFASHKPVADKIVRDIFNKYRNRGGS